MLSRTPKMPRYPAKLKKNTTIITKPEVSKSTINCTIHERKSVRMWCNTYDKCIMYAEIFLFWRKPACPAATCSSFERNRIALPALLSAIIKRSSKSQVFLISSWLEDQSVNCSIYFQLYLPPAVIVVKVPSFSDWAASYFVPAEWTSENSRRLIVARNSLIKSDQDASMHNEVAIHLLYLIHLAALV